MLAAGGRDGAPKRSGEAFFHPARNVQAHPLVHHTPTGRFERARELRMMKASESAHDGSEERITFCALVERLEVVARAQRECDSFDGSPPQRGIHGLVR
jgi:hypothetical protein